MNKTILSTAAMFGLLAVALGAFAAHGLGKLISVSQVETFKTGVTYQMYHALFLLFLGVNQSLKLTSKKLIYSLTVLGILFFSGSIYGLATNDLSSFDFKTIALITPLGGLFFIAAWAVLFISILKQKRD